MSLPIIIGGAIVAVVGVANKATPYHEDDLMQLLLLMGSAWLVVDRRRAESEHIQQLTSALAEKDGLLHELHHRVKNNLQLVLSLVNLQANLYGEPTLEQHFRKLEFRIRSIAGVHELMYQQDALDPVRLDEHLKAMAVRTREYLRSHASAITTDVELDPIVASVEVAVPVGLLVNEVLTNSARHAFPPSFDGSPCVHLRLKDRGDGVVELLAADNGVGIPYFGSAPVSPGIGLSLVAQLGRQIGADVRVATRTDGIGGTSYTMEFRPIRETPIPK